MNNQQRRSPRLQGYDYTQSGAYYVTICTQDRVCLFGNITDGALIMNDFGRIVEGCWLAIPSRFAHVNLDVFVIMPNHVHGIVVVAQVGTRHASSLQNKTMTIGARQGSLGAIVGSFKAAVTRRINLLRETPGERVWQERYYDHIIRDEAGLYRIREYITTNPVRWSGDRDNPNVPHGDM